MLSHHRNLASVIAAAAAGVVLLGGCSSTPKSSSSEPSGQASNSSSAVGGAVTVTATETDFKISLSQSSFKPGAYTFKVLNHGKAPHNLTLEGPGVDRQASPTMPGGGSGQISVTLQAGTYELLCSVGNHKDRGMDMQITVA